MGRVGRRERTIEIPTEGPLLDHPGPGTVLAGLLRRVADRVASLTLPPAVAPSPAVYREAGRVEGGSHTMLGFHAWRAQQED